MDELCVAACALEPRQIVALMKENTPPPAELASAPETGLHGKATGVK
jgi:hypothetical protein